MYSYTGIRVHIYMNTYKHIMNIYIAHDVCVYIYVSVLFTYTKFIRKKIKVLHICKKNI